MEQVRVTFKCIGLLSIMFLFMVGIATGCQQSSSKMSNQKNSAASEEDLVLDDAHEKMMADDQHQHQHPDSSGMDGSGEVLEEDGAIVSDSDSEMEEDNDDNSLPAKAQFVELKHDVGEIEAGEDLKYSFKVKNVGPGVLKITSVRPG